MTKKRKQKEREGEESDKEKDGEKEREKGRKRGKRHNLVKVRKPPDKFNATDTVMMCDCVRKKR